MRMWASSLTACVFFAFSVSAHAWGKVGHAAVADLAEERLTPAALAQVKELLAVEHDKHLSDIASWADEAKSEGLEGSPSHTIRLPMDNHPAREHPCPGGFCAGDAIERYSAVLSDKTKPAAEREVALKYIVHLVGDLHQPLHDVDATGSHYNVMFEGEKETLHWVWDDGILYDISKDHSKLAKRVDADHLDVKTGGTPMDWAIEGRIIAQQQIYGTHLPLKPESTITLSPDYAQKNWPIVEQRLTQAGIRLADVLNKLLQ